MKIINRFFGEHRFLSNFYPAFVFFEGRKYRTVEHAYQAAKTLDEDWRSKIWWAPTPADARRIGRRAPMREDWEVVKLIVMGGFLRQKFQDRVLRRDLLRTERAELIETNTWGDTFWGVCNGKGQNNLGKLLMQVREEIRVELEHVS